MLQLAPSGCILQQMKPTLHKQTARDYQIRLRQETIDRIALCQDWAKSRLDMSMTLTETANWVTQRLLPVDIMSPDRDQNFAALDAILGIKSTLENRLSTGKNTLGNFKK